MREIKDSGIEWLQEIPSNWNCIKGKYFLKYLQKPIKEDDGVITCFRDGKVTLRSNRREDGFTVADKEIGYQGIDVGDLVVHGMDGFAGSIGISDSRGKASPVLNVLDTNENKRYIMYYLRSMAYTDVFLALATGIRVRSCDLRWNKLAELPYPIPSKSEQERIVSLLDSKCAKIDTLIADIQAEIDILEQYKKSVITEAVTKGLDPNAEMKDSGLSWVTKIPSTWNIIPSKFLFHNSDLRRMSGDLQLTSSQKYGIISQSEYMERENVKIVLANQGVDNWKHVEPNDFIISLRSFQGGLEMSEVTGCITWHYVVLKASRPIVPQFYKWLFKSSVYINALQGTANFIRDGQDLRFSNFSKVPLYEPPLAEQKAIAEYLEEKCSKIDTTISDKQEQINLLFAYKKSLIYEYVTGKKEVPTINLASVVTVDPQVILLGGIVKRIGNSQHGRTQLQKLLYLCNTHLGMNQNIQYYRYEHGPYDVHLNEYIRELVKNQWFNEKSQDKNCLLVSGKKWQEFEQNYPNPFGEKKKEISELFKQLKNLSTKQIERIATLYAAWNDFLLDGITPSDDQIIQDVVTNWTENKANFKHSTWQESLNQMKQFGLIPKGTGLHTLPKPEKGGLNNE